jgi:hypothetical protein
MRHRPSSSIDRSRGPSFRGVVCGAVSSALLLSVPASAADDPAPGGASAAATPAAEADPSDPRQVAKLHKRATVLITEEDRLLIERPDRKRPDHPITFPIFGREFQIGGRYTLRSVYVEDRLLDEVEPGDPPDKVDHLDVYRLNQSLLIDAFYPLTENIALYAAATGFWRNKIYSSDGNEEAEWDLERDETWLYWGRMFGTPFATQIGRQRFSDESEWWWDEDLDSARLRFDLESLHLEVAGARRMAKVSVTEDFVDPEADDLWRVLFFGQYEWARKQVIGLHVLHQWDDSDHLAVRTPVDPEREDESDAELTWFGASLAGKRRLPAGAGLFTYRAHVAGVIGEETFVDYRGSNENRQVGRVFEHDVKGWGLDAWATWQMPLPLKPSLTFGYAYGSGEKGATEEEDGSFRQTGLQDNNDAFMGVDSFHYYGELFDPELSNMHIVSGALGIRFLRNSSLEFVYHYYRQVRGTDFIRDAEFKRDPTGLKRTLGHEWDLVLGVEEWNRIEIELIGGIFKAGSAFGDIKGELSYLGFAQVRLNF